MQILTSIHLLARLGRIRPIRKRHKRKTLRPPRLPILGQKHTRNMSKPAKHIPQILLLSNLRHIRHAQRRQIIALKLAAHLLAGATTTTQMRRHIARTTLSERAGLGTTASDFGHIGGRVGTLGRHGILERTLCGPVVARADAALDLCVLEVGFLLCVFGFVLGGGLPAGDGAEEDILGDGGGVGLGAGRLALLLAKFGPLLALGDAGVDGRLNGGLFDATGRLDLLAVFAERVGYDGLAAVFVLGDGGLGEGEGVVILLFGPVGASMWC